MVLLYWRFACDTNNNHESKLSGRKKTLDNSHYLDPHGHKPFGHHQIVTVCAKVIQVPHWLKPFGPLECVAYLTCVCDPHWLKPFGPRMCESHSSSALALSALLNDVAYLTCVVIRIGLSLSALIIMTSNHNLMVYQQ